jgi:hypothetical protein
MEAKAWIMEKRPPITAASTKARGMEKPMVVSRSTWVVAAVMAPMAMRPSRAMFTTPALSQIIPPVAAMSMGATIIKVEGSMFQSIVKISGMRASL